ncbi:phosphoglucosamine mutase [Candidatus Woesearchaeota archaeon]|nr:phosphoglucosamine mutase [Candidatus Woesearchaeota archaeon]
MEFFGTDGIRGVANQYPLDPVTIVKIGAAIAAYAKNYAERPRVLIGKDTRLSGYLVENALTSGIVGAGADVMLIGPLPTPAIAHLTRSMGAHLGVVISASHNPAPDNGIKLFDRDGHKLSVEQEEEIESLILAKSEDERLTGTQIGKARRIDDARGRYIEYAKSTVADQNLDGLSVVLDCANGAASPIAKSIYAELGAHTIVYHNTPDGVNINEGCGALHPKFLAEKVKEHNADIGIAFDGDADRAIFVDERGEVIDGDAILYAIAHRLAKDQALGSLVVTTYSNMGLDSSLREIGVDVIRVACGDKFVMEAMREGGHSFGGENSGHLIFGNHSTTGDGIVAGLQIMRVLKKDNIPASRLAEGYIPNVQVLNAVEVREKIPLEQLPKTNDVIQRCQEELAEAGRVYFRYSGTENKARILVEAKEQHQADRIMAEVLDALNEDLR